jgi:mono/diheme cytochrome c family protein
MLAQAHLSKAEAAAIVEYIKSFSSRFETEKPGRAVATKPKPSESSRLIALGKSKYEEAGCAQCHGRDGRAESASTNGLKDDWGEPISATDLTLKPFKSGPNPEDLYRTISTGLNGTPMPSYADVLTPEERWSLVFYIFSIATRERPRGMMGLVGEEVQGMRIDMRAAMGGMMGRRGMMGRGGGMMDRNRRDMMKDMMGR